MLPHFKNILRCYVANLRFFYYFIIINSMMFCFFTINTRYSRTKMHADNKLVPEPFYASTSSIANDNLSATNNSTKYILLWTSPRCFPFVYFGEGNNVFVNKKCKWKNCHVTSDRNYLGRYTEFDVIAFNGPQISLMLYTSDIPTERSTHQKYVYANIESAKNYPINTEIFNGFFNWTWTYKLNSDAVWGYFAVKDAKNNVIGPKVNMHWLSVNNMEPVDEQLINSLQSKNKAAVWFSSNCLTSSRREEYIHSLQHYLNNYNMDVDIYGECGPSQCPKQIMQHCLNMVRKDYYFYLAFENAFSDDYVTEKLVYALNYDAVPVVYGGANYSRFLPEGSYLDAVKLDPKMLAQTMFEVIQDPERYYTFFRWKKHYSFHFKHESPDTDDYCKFCAILNNETLVRSYSVYDNFSFWWMDKNKLMPEPYVD